MYEGWHVSGRRSWIIILRPRNLPFPSPIVIFPVLSLATRQLEYSTFAYVVSAHRVGLCMLDLVSLGRGEALANVDHISIFFPILRSVHSIRDRRDLGPTDNQVVCMHSLQVTIALSLTI